MTFCFAGYTIDVGRRELRLQEEVVHVEPQVFDVLVYLIENRDRVVTKNDLFAAVWQGRIVSETTLSSRINAARRAIGDTGEKQQMIRTVARTLTITICAAWQLSIGGPGTQTKKPCDFFIERSNLILISPWTTALPRGVTANGRPIVG